MNNISSIITSLQQGDHKALARAISIVENDLPGCEEILENISIRNIPLIGITGPPGAGKSSLVNALVRILLARNKKIGVVAVDPTSPFNFGSLLGDRIRLSEHFSHPDIFIRSLATRGSLGGLSEKIVEVTDTMKAFPFDYLFVETVGVGQSEVEIAGLADTTVVVLSPQSGDEVQTMKAGLLEIADIFIVNKADQPEADRLVANLKTLSYTHDEKEQVPVLKTIATSHEGISEVIDQIEKQKESLRQNERRAFLLAEKAWRIIEKQRMYDVDRNLLRGKIEAELAKGKFNVYRWVHKEFPAKTH